MPSDRKFWNKIARKYAKDPIADVAAYETPILDKTYC